MKVSLLKQPVDATGGMEVRVFQGIFWNDEHVLNMILTYCVKYLWPIVNIQPHLTHFESFPVFLSNHFQYLHVRQIYDVMGVNVVLY